MVRNEKQQTRSHALEKLAEQNGIRHPVYWTVSRGDVHSKYKYSGEWKDGKRHGYGVLMYGNGDKYEGDWVQNLRQGNGTYWKSEKHKLRQKYTGEWKSDRMHGFGVFYYPQGARYEGDWSHDKRHGTGRMEFGDRVSDDTFITDVSTVYDGAWCDDQRCGRGVLSLPNGDRYDGSWIADKKQGPGMYYYIKSNRVYVGEWIDGVPKCGTYEALPAEGESVSSTCSSKLPKLELIEPQRILSERVNQLRKDRDDGVRFGEGNDKELTGDSTLDSNEVCQLPEVMFDGDTLDRLENVFSSIQNREIGNGIEAKELKQLAECIEMQFDEFKAQELMVEVGITETTVLTFPECVEMLSLMNSS